MEENIEPKLQEETESKEETKKSFNPLLIFGALVLVLIVGYLFFKNRSGSPKVEGVSSESQVPAGPVKEFTISGSNFSFTPNKITVNKGDSVKITFKDNDGHHNLAIDGYNVVSDTIDSGGSSVVEFTADKAGSFEFYCSVDSHRDKGMTGTLVVQ